MSWIDTEGDLQRGGLRFKCTQCGDCCAATNGVVLVDEEDRIRIARRMGLPLDEFDRLCTWSYDDEVRTLKTVPGQGCILFNPTKRTCTVYGDHPLQCRTYPMWLGNVKSPEAWEKTCKSCPGAGTAQGNFIPVETIRRCVMANVRL